MKPDFKTYFCGFVAGVGVSLIGFIAGAILKLLG